MATPYPKTTPKKPVSKTPMVAQKKTAAPVSKGKVFAPKKTVAPVSKGKATVPKKTVAQVEKTPTTAQKKTTAPVSKSPNKGGYVSNLNNSKMSPSSDVYLTTNNKGKVTRAENKGTGQTYKADKSGLVVKTAKGLEGDSFSHAIDTVGYAAGKKSFPVVVKKVNLGVTPAQTTTKVTRYEVGRKDAMKTVEGLKSSAMSDGYAEKIKKQNQDYRKKQIKQYMKKGGKIGKLKGKLLSEKKTGEKYASKSAMMKHEKGESKKMRMMEGEIPMKKKGGTIKKFGDGGKTAAQLKKEGIARRDKGLAMKMQGQAMKKAGQEQFLERAKTAQDLINFRVRKGQLQDMDPEMLAKLKTRINKASEIKKAQGVKKVGTVKKFGDGGKTIKKVPANKYAKEQVYNLKKGSEQAKGAYVATNSGTVYQIKYPKSGNRASILTMDTTGYSKGKPSYNLDFENGNGSVKSKTVKRKDVKPLLKNMKKEVISMKCGGKMHKMKKGGKKC